MTRRILIMGGSRGIGRACALHLARAEATHLVLLGRDAGTLADTSRAIGAAGGTVDIFVANVTERTRLAEVAQHLGPLDGLVAPAGISGMTPVDRDSDVFFNEILGGRPHGPLEYRAGLPPEAGLRGSHHAGVQRAWPLRRGGLRSLLRRQARPARPNQGPGPWNSSTGASW